MSIEQELKQKEGWVLGNTDTKYESTYDKSKLIGMSRTMGDRRKGFKPMSGFDIWTAFEFSFLKPSGLPFFGVIRVAVDCNTPNFFESKSFKLYLNTFNNTVFESVEEAIKVVETDLKEVTQGNVFVWLVEEFPESYLNIGLEKTYPNVVCKDYTYNKSLLVAPDLEEDEVIYQCFNTNLLRSNCEITNQPDWATVCVDYEGRSKVINEQSFLQYIVSYRNHQEFHEPTCERIFQDLLEVTDASELEVACMYTRRGGIDINPIRFKEGFMIWGTENFYSYLSGFTRQISQ